MATAGYLTRGTIVSEGLELGGNPGLTTRATTFLNMLLDHIYRSQDWEFLLKTATVQADATTFYQIPNSALPTDYRAIRQLFPVNDTSGTASGALMQVPYEQLLTSINNDVFQGQTISTLPSRFAVDEGNGAGQSDIYLYPIPDHRITFNLRYYRLPDVSAYTDSSKVEFPDSWALVGAVAHYAQAYDKEQLQIIIRQEAKSIADEYRLNHRDRGRAGVEILPMDETTFKNLRQDQNLPWPRPT